ncbi:alkene reductase [Marinobacterium rhizophilum]|uniref:alkene reductase n=1 Tax=Marinobacterium rhizophilum TaxID=420402 RepID=UPI00036E07F8|nr:alkene reductase [Marinobacterium rhizophilum]
MPSLFDPVKIGDIELSSRIVMAPLTRCRADEGRVPSDLMREYYSQRASAGLIITEATSVTPMGVGYPNTPGIWNQAQVAGWQRITDAVHAKGGKIVLQLWHVGRISDPVYLNGELPVAPSAIAPAGHISLVRPERPFTQPRALELSEMPAIVEAFRQGAENARAAGFDGVEIHAANGYLIDQFLQDSSNKRTDAYGGPIENRARLLLEITDAVLSVWKPGEVGVHLSPRGDAHDMGDSDPAAVFSFVASALSARDIAFICAREAEGEDSLVPTMKQLFSGAFIANERFTGESANAWIEDGRVDAVAFGVPFIANPDLPQRLRQQVPLNTPDSSTFYGSGAEGYTTYPAI